MANVTYNTDDMEIFSNIEVGTYFIYQSQLFVRINENETEKDVFSFNDDNIFCWYDKFDSNALVQIIFPNRININID